MSSIRIRGGQPLTGRVQVSGRKNAALPLIAATLLTEGTSVLENIPRIHDVALYQEILMALGAPSFWDKRGRLTIDTRRLTPRSVPMHQAQAMRASYYLLGVLLARFGEAHVPLPGGDNIGRRPVDQHIKGLTALGADVWIADGMIHARADRLVGTHIFFDVVSVGATIQLMLAASLAEGTTVLHNCAREPHVVNTASFINAAGGRVTGAGTDTIRITGVPGLRGTVHTVIPDDIEAATWMIGAVMTGGDVVLESVIPEHLETVCAKLQEAGAKITIGTDWIRVRGPERPEPVHVTTLPYPGFPTDAQSQMTAMLTLARGISRVTETVYEDRFRFVCELQRMGAEIVVRGQTASIYGVEYLSGAEVEATDIRAGAALILAGLAAQGETVVHGLHHVERGYERLEEKLRAMGAEVSVQRSKVAVG